MTKSYYREAFGNLLFWRVLGTKTSSNGHDYQAPLSIKEKDVLGNEPKGRTLQALIRDKSKHEDGEKRLQRLAGCCQE